MQLKQSVAPHFRLEETVRSTMLSELIAAGALLAAAVVLHGFRAFIAGFLGVCGALLVEILWRWLAKQEQTFTDLSAVVTGMLIALLLPVSQPVLLSFFAAAFAVGIVKLPFGGFGRAPFNAAAAGCCFITMLCAAGKGAYNRALLSAPEREIFDKLPQRFFTYAGGKIPVFANIVPSESHLSDEISPLVLLRSGTDPELSIGKILFGGMFGPAGAGIALLVILCGVWLYFRHSLAWQSAIAYCASVAAVSFLFPWEGVPRLMSPVYDLFGGAVLLTAVFIYGDTFTAPHFRSARILCGICGGILTIVLHRTGSVEYGELFAALIMNACATLFDRFVWSCRQRGISMTKTLDKLKQRLKKVFRFRSGPFDDIDLDELYSRRKGGDDDE